MKKTLVIAFQSLTKTNAGGTGKLAYYIAQQLHSENNLVSLIVSSKGKFKTTFPSKAVAGISRYYLWALNRMLSLRLFPAYYERYLEETLFDYLCQKHITDEVGLIISTNPFLDKTLKKATRRGIKSVLIPGNPADSLIFARVVEEKTKWGIHGEDAYTFKPRLRKFEKSIALFDLIICHSSVIGGTFKGTYQAKKIIDCYGALWPGPLERSAPLVQSDKFVVLYVAYTVLLKGLQYLLSAWQMLSNIEAELWIIGSIDPMVKAIIEREFENLKNVKYFGQQRSLSFYYEQASLFVAPSVIEGGPVSALEAMSHRVPVLITEACGVKDIIQDGKNGLITPIRDSQAIADKIEWSLQNKNDLALLGAAGYYALQQFNFNVFIDQLIDVVKKNTVNRE